MKSPLLIYSVAAAFLLCGRPAFGEDELTPPPVPEFDQAVAKSFDVRVEVLMVSMPQDKALALLPDLRDPAKIDGAFAHIMAAIGRKEATLTGLPMVVSPSGQKAITETIVEKRYPSEYDSTGDAPPIASPATQATPQTAPADPASVPARVKSKERVAIPSSFETRNVGPTLEVESTVSADGQTLDLSLVATRVELLAFDTYYSLKTADGVSKVEQPRFMSLRATTTVTLRSGQRCLLAVHRLAQPEGHLEFFIVQGTAFIVK